MPNRYDPSTFRPSQPPAPHPEPPRRPDPMFVHVRIAAARLGVSRAWLKSLIAEGTIPHLQISRSVFVHLDGARERLKAMAELNAPNDPTRKDANE